jgi:hypothetical protein
MLVTCAYLLWLVVTVVVESKPSILLARGRQCTGTHLTVCTVHVVGLGELDKPVPGNALQSHCTTKLL